MDEKKENGEKIEKPSEVSQEEKVKKVKTPSEGCSQRFQRAVIGNIEVFFYRYGKFVARYPFVVILLSCLISLICTLPYFIYYHLEKDDFELWVPRNYEYYRDGKWLKKNFPSTTRYSVVLLETQDDTIITGEHIRNLFQIHTNIGELSTRKNNITWSQVCSKWPNPWTKQEECAVNSLLELWASDGTYDKTNETLFAKTDEELLIDVNTISSSGIFNFPVSLKLYLGSIERNGSDIETAKVLQMTLQIDLDPENIEESKARAEEFEQEFLYMMDIYSDSMQVNTNVYYMAQKSIADVGNDAMAGDANLLSMGFIMVFIFVILNLGKFNSVEQRGYLSLLGMVAIVLGTAVSYGICSLLGFEGGTLHEILPFMLLGIGIDDMFVIVQGLNNVQKEKRNLGLSVEERIGLAMKHSGVAITITSVTDLMAFGIGATSVIPALANFCFYAALGIFAVFLNMISFFLGWLVIDQQRIDAKRDGMLCCLKKKDDWSPNDCSQKSFLDMSFRKYANALDNKIFKAVILVITLGLFAISCYGVSLLKSNFDFVNWFPKESYLAKYFRAKARHFPDDGIYGKIYVVELPDIEQKLSRIQDLVDEVGNVPDLEGNKIRSFLPHFFNWFSLKATLLVDRNLTNQEFRSHLRDFLCGEGFIWTNDIYYDRDAKLDCVEMDETPPIKMMTFGIQHITHPGDMLAGYKGYKQVDDAVRGFDLGLNGTSKVFAFSNSYIHRITLSIVVEELSRNIMLAMVCVFICSLFLIANLPATIIVCFTVAITLTDVAGFMHFWGIEIDTTSAVLLSVGLGLAVDYSAHIAHAFMATSGKSKDERIKHAVIEIGPAVFNGGFSTFLAFAILMVSQSFAFTIFFKVFFLVVVFGLYHGLVFLPVLLSFIGPAPISSSHGIGDYVKEKKENHDMDTMESTASIKSAWSVDGDKKRNKDNNNDVRY